MIEAMAVATRRGMIAAMGGGSMIAVDPRAAGCMIRWLALPAEDMMVADRGVPRAVCRNQPHYIRAAPREITEV